MSGHGGVISQMTKQVSLKFTIATNKITIPIRNSTADPKCGGGGGSEGCSCDSSGGDDCSNNCSNILIVINKAIFLDFLLFFFPFRLYNIKTNFWA